MKLTEPGASRARAATAMTITAIFCPKKLLSFLSAFMIHSPFGFFCWATAGFGDTLHR